MSKVPLKNAFKEGIGADSSKPPCKKAKLLRLERKKEKLLKQGLSLEKKQPAQSQKSIEEFLDEISQNSKHKLRVCSLNNMVFENENRKFFFPFTFFHNYIIFFYTRIIE